MCGVIRLRVEDAGGGSGQGTATSTAPLPVTNEIIPSLVGIAPHSAHVSEPYPEVVHHSERALQRCRQFGEHRVALAEVHGRFRLFSPVALCTFSTWSTGFSFSRPIPIPMPQARESTCTTSFASRRLCFA